MAPRLRGGKRTRSSTALIETGIEARGGNAFLLVSGRGRIGETCPPSVMPIVQLPGHDRYAQPRHLAIRVPTCRVTRFETIRVPEGPFIGDGPGDPPVNYSDDKLLRDAEQIVPLPAYAIDRTEITNAAYAVFSEMFDVHDIAASTYSSALGRAAGPLYPRAMLDWFDART